MQLAPASTHVREVKCILVNEVDDAPRGAHHNVHAAAQLLQLGADGVAAVVAAQLEGGGGGGDLALDLQRKGEAGGGEERQVWRYYGAG